MLWARAKLSEKWNIHSFIERAIFLWLDVRYIYTRDITLVQGNYNNVSKSF